MWRVTLLSRPPAAQVALDIGDQRLQHRPAGGHRRRRAEQPAIDLGQQIGVLVGGAAQRHAVHVRQMRLGLLERGDAAVEDDLELGCAALRR